MPDGIDQLELGDEQAWEPMRIVPPDPWTGHLSFAYWLIRQLRPTLLVELGTHSANSYFALCQALAATDPAGRAFAVDTWKGDEHAGHYDEDVFSGVSAFNNAHFLAFSTLLRTTFNDARSYFADGSIDLLHIDGMHTYEAVRGDFELWSTALSPRSVVLFHDTNVRERGFGVWRLWQELRAQYPSFEFHHSHGLGVLGIGTDLPPPVRALFELSAKGAARLRSRIAARGEAFQRAVQLQNLHIQLDGVRLQVEAAAEQGRNQAEQLSQQVEYLKQQTKAHTDLLHWRDAVILRNEQTAAAQSAVIDAHRAAIRARDAAMAERDRMLQERDAHAGAREGLVGRMTGELAGYKAELQRQIAASEIARERLESRVQRVLTNQACAQAEADAQLLRAQARTAALEADNEALRTQARVAAHEADAESLRAQARVAAIYTSSTSWRLSMPLRLAARLVTRRHSNAAPAPVAPFQPPPLPELSSPSPLPELPPPPPELLAQAPQAPEPPPLETAPVTAPEPGIVAKQAMRDLMASRLRAFFSTSQRLHLPRATAPQISILLVLYNQAELTFMCLSSIIETLGPGSPTVEVIIVDNASSDSTGELLGRVEGARIVRNTSNLHFLKGVNQAARMAAGTHLLLLNNDAQLMPGAVTAALAVLAADPTIGAVGGRIILPDGTLQEAGSIVWSDGSCSGYGRGRQPDDPEFMFARDVDYCSGAFLLTPRAVFETLGSFDERYSPAYYEETDYCLRLWQSGRRVHFDPDVAIMHMEFGSASSSEAALALQARNRDVFVSQHRDWLAAQYPPSQLNMLPARVSRSRAKRVLMIEDRLPKPELGAGYPRAQQIVRELVATGAEVTFFPASRHAETWPDVHRTLGKSVEHFIHADVSQIRPFLESRLSFYDAVLVCRPHNMERFLDAVTGKPDVLSGAKVLYDAEAVFAVRSLQQLEAAGTPASEDEAARLVAAEIALTRTAEAVISVSPNEQRIFENHGVKTVHVLGHALAEEPIPGGFEDRTQVVFLGAMHYDDAPNSDALRWFASEILPPLRVALEQDIRLDVVGWAEAPSIRALDGTALNLMGPIDDLAPALRHARIMVVPSRLGAGIPLKVYQGAAMGIPMVVTGLIRDQLDWKDGQEVLVADDAAGFAAACARLYRDRDLWTMMRERALARVRRETNPLQFRATVRAILNAVPVTHRVREPERAPVWEPALLAAPPPPAEPDVARAASDDWAMAVPFNYTPAQASVPRVAAVLHMFYPDLAPEMLHYLSNIPVATDLFVSTDTVDKKASLETAFTSWTRGTLEVRVTPNRGRDIAPKLVGFADVYGRYDLVCHLHSKVSDHAPFLAPWRSFMLENLLGSPFIVRSLLEAFDRLPDLGIVMPQHFEAVRRWLNWNGNFTNAKALAGRMGVTLHNSRALDFPSGSMFWARPAALQPLLDLHLRFEDFPDEGAQVDHTPAHAIERLYLYACERSGHTWLKVAQPALYFDTSTVATIRSPADIGRFAVNHGVLLTGPDPIPVRAEPAPVLTSVPPGLAQVLTTRRL